MTYSFTKVISNDYSEKNIHSRLAAVTAGLSLPPGGRAVASGRVIDGRVVEGRAIYGRVHPVLRPLGHHLPHVL